MAGILDPIQDIKTQLAAITLDGVPAFATVRIWNSQKDFEKEGQYIDYPKPAALVEVVNDNPYVLYGAGVSMGDVVFRIHIIHEEYDAGGNTFDQNVNVFTYVNLVKRHYVAGGLGLFEPTRTGPLAWVAEAQDYEHDNIYEYTVDFLASYTDNSGSPYNPDNGIIIYKDPPTNLEIDVQVSDSIEGQCNSTIIPRYFQYRIPQ